MSIETETKTDKNNPWFYSTLILCLLFAFGATALIAYKLGQSDNPAAVSSAENTNSGNINSINTNKNPANISASNESPTATAVPNTADRKISGEMFIVTKGRDNIKLALVEVCAVSDQYIYKWLANKKREAAKQIAISKKKIEEIIIDKTNYSIENVDADRYEVQRKLNDFDHEIRMAQIEQNYWTSPEYYLAGLVQCEYRTQTDSDGRYSLTLPGGKKYALSATTSRRVFNSTETYWWLLWANGPKVNFNNETLMSQNPPNSVTRIEY